MPLLKHIVNNNKIIAEAEKYSIDWNEIKILSRCFEYKNENRYSQGIFICKSENEMGRMRCELCVSSVNCFINNSQWIYT